MRTFLVGYVLGFVFGFAAAVAVASVMVQSQRQAEPPEIEIIIGRRALKLCTAVCRGAELSSIGKLQDRYLQCGCGFPAVETIRIKEMSHENF